MSRLKEFKYFGLVLLLFCFVAAGTLSSCRDEKKKENTEESAEHPEGEEHPTEDAGEHPEGEEEHPEGKSEEHPEGEEHPTDSISG